MANILAPRLTDADIRIIENVDRKILKESIRFLRTYTEVLWRDSSTGDIVSLNKLRKRKVRVQPHPIYPQELEQMARMFRRALRAADIIHVDLKAEGFFTNNSLASYCTGSMYSAALIASLICDAHLRERFCDGLFVQGVDNGLYLKMLLRMEDLIAYHDYLKCDLSKANDDKNKPGDSD